MNLKIYYDAEQEVDWFVGLDKRLENSIKLKLKKRGQNEDSIVNELIIYDRPDIILLVNGIPKLVLEKTEEVPSGHNVGQRIARLVRAAELGIPIVKFFPFVAMKHGKYAGRCFVRPNIFTAFFKMKEIHKTHALAIDWKCDKDYELIRDNTESEDLKKLFSDFIDNKFSFNGLKRVADIEKKMVEEMNERVKSNIMYRRLAKSLIEIKTKDLIMRYPKVILPPREKTLVYEINMEPNKCRREDPYTGNQFIYDYSYCRNGPKFQDRNMNLVFSFPKISKEKWKVANPLDEERKSYLWYVLADALLFNDGFLSRVNNFE